MGKKVLCFLGGVAAGVAGTLGTCAIYKHVKAKKAEKYTELPKKEKEVEVKADDLIKVLERQKKSIK